MSKTNGSTPAALGTVVHVSAAIDLRAASRILVYGVTGSGKSTMAAKLSSATGIPWYSVDDLTWEPGWQVVPVDEQRRRVEAICQREDWIIDSAYSAWLDVPWARVELIIGLDYPRWQSFGRLCRRTLIRMVDRTVICNGNRESLRNTLSKDSILAWHFQIIHEQARAHPGLGGRPRSAGRTTDPIGARSATAVAGDPGLASCTAEPPLAMNDYGRSPDNRRRSSGMSTFISDSKVAAASGCSRSANASNKCWGRIRRDFSAVV
jgi:adenylate kinase family enzyme